MENEGLGSRALNPNDLAPKILSKFTTKSSWSLKNVEIGFKPENEQQNTSLKSHKRPRVQLSKPCPKCGALLKHNLLCKREGRLSERHIAEAKFT